MDPRAKEIFLEAIEHPPDARRAWVRDNCADEAVQHDVLRLLDVHESGPALAPPAIEMGGIGERSANVSMSEQAGDEIGNYQLLRQIGEGGFGVVFLARQHRPVIRDVALKVLKTGMHSAQVIARFEAERQALALMDHPNIARVYDAGATASGRPYFVMEYFPGDPITAYCQRHRLDLAARLELVEQVCLAIQHAHQKGVIHRDLKPTNILVAEMDGRALPKVIDFGIAKAVDVEHSPVLTTEAQIIGTPQYMSPEQATPGGAGTDTRSDIYSLGAVLYELLVGVPPFDPAELRGGPEQMALVVREREPARPSTRLGQLSRSGDGGARSDAVGTGMVDPSRLRKQLAGEIDWIVMKALEKEPHRRYQSAAEMAADLRRCLRHESVLARPPSRLYQARKFVRRHRIETVAATIVAAALIGTAAVSLAMATRARRAEVQAVREAEQAARELARASAVARLNETILRGVAPGAARGRDITLLRELLAKAADEVPQYTQQQPGVECAVRTMIGRAYLDLTQVDDAIKQLELARQAGRSADPDQRRDVLKTEVVYATALRTAERYADAEKILVDTIGAYRALPSPSPLDGSQAEGNLAVVYLDTGRTVEAERLLARLLQLRAAAPPDDEVTLSIMSDLAVARLRLGRTADALDIWLKQLPLERRVRGDDHPSTLSTLNNLGTAYERLSQTKQANGYFREALEIKRKIYPPGHPSLIRSLQNLGGGLMTEGRLDEAAALLEEASNSAHAHLGAEHELTLSIGIRLARVRLKQQRFDESIALITTVHQGYAKRFGLGHWRTVQALAQLLSILADTQRFEQGAEALATLAPPSLEAGLDTEIKAQFLVTSSEILLGSGQRQAAAERAAEAARVFETATISDGTRSRYLRLLAKLEEEQNGPTSHPAGP